MEKARKMAIKNLELKIKNYIVTEHGEAVEQTM
jgi:hypothetical protein